MSMYTSKEQKNRFEFGNREKLKVGILGATGLVGQQYVKLLENHPWFLPVTLAASPRSAGKSYGEAVWGKWHIEGDVPGDVKNVKVKNALEVEEVSRDVDFLFSAVSLGKEETKILEWEYAKKGTPVVSNNSAHRWTHDIPIVIPEINHGHLEIIRAQQKRLGNDRGFITTKPNCSIQGFLLALAPLMEAGYIPQKLVTTNLQALSGAGYPGQAAIDLVDNCTHLPGEEIKTISEPKKILGTISDDAFENFSLLDISAHCMRVAVSDGHLSNVSVGFGDRVPSMEEVLHIWEAWRPLPQQLELPSAPAKALIYTKDPMRPQHKKDRDAGKGMTTTIGRLRKCDVLDYRFSCLSHNTLRGAAGGALLTAELLTARGWIK